ncbi:MAG: hypothetical protein II328_05855, partial [Clostridia bacterium]|nr:hypothetical protein [Clostridia bacterium]
TDTVCGPFIHTLPLRIRTDPECTAENWMKRVAETVSGMLDHQQTALEDIITALDLPRGAQNALYRVMLTQSPVDENAFRLGGNPMTFRAIPTGVVKMDMILEIARKEHSRSLRFSYARSVFAEETVAFWGRCLEQALRELIRGGERKITPAALQVLVDGCLKAAYKVPANPIKSVEIAAYSLGADLDGSHFISVTAMLEYEDNAVLNIPLTLDVILYPLAK